MAEKQTHKERLKEITDSIETGIKELFESDKYKSYLQTIPNVILDDGKDGYEIEIEYQENEIDLTSTRSGELSKAIHAGQIPDAYKDAIESI